MENLKWTFDVDDYFDGEFYAFTVHARSTNPDLHLVFESQPGEEDILDVVDADWNDEEDIITLKYLGIPFNEEDAHPIWILKETEFFKNVLAEAQEFLDKYVKENFG